MNLHPLPKEAVKLFVNDLKSFGVTGEHIIIGQICCDAKESGFVPKMESSYAHTDNARLRKLFGVRLSKFGEQQLTDLKANDVKFFDAIYMGVDGNYLPGHGYKYRGGGLNGLTGYSLYLKYGKLIGIDLVTYPEKINEIEIALKVAAVYAKNVLDYGNTHKEKSTDIGSYIAERYGVSNYNLAPDDKVGVQIAVNGNAGWGKDTRGVEAEVHALSFLGEVREIYNNLK